MVIQLGEIRAFGYTPDSTVWAPCDGTFFEETVHPALFNLIGYTHGGGGGVFALPNYNQFNDGRTPLYYIAVSGSYVDPAKVRDALNQSTREANNAFAR